jgi:amino acid permease
LLQQQISVNVLLKDLARFMAVLAIFVFGFSMNMVSLNQPFQPPSSKTVQKVKSSATFSEGKFYKAP